jgi:hypothetical protein
MKLIGCLEKIPQQKDPGSLLLLRSEAVVGVAFRSLLFHSRHTIRTMSSQHCARELSVEVTLEQSKEIQQQLLPLLFEMEVPLSGRITSSSPPRRQRRRRRRGFSSRFQTQRR